ncbi:MAG: hypothetical protein IPN01_28990 [Deltaproteobacteria bacterium]|nr:hypothetical protein [Deltaproteobacteria bacterium]
MMYARAVERSQSHLDTLRAMIEGTRSPITRRNLESRLEEAEAEVRLAEQQSATLAEAELLFDGGPVRAQLGIEARFGGQSVQVFQDLVAAVTGDLGLRGALPQAPRLLITGVETGSFGFQLSEVPDQLVLTGPSPLKLALDETTRLLHAAAESDETFTERLTGRSGRVLTQLKLFLRVLTEAQATLKVETGQVSLRLDDVERIKAARDRAESTTIQETPERRAGRLIGLMQLRAQFELRDEAEGVVVSGRIAPELSLDAVTALYNQRVFATLGRVTTANNTRSRVTWVLRDIQPAEADPS